MPARFRLTRRALDVVRIELARGATFTAACRAAGFTERSGARYRRRGEKLRADGVVPGPTKSGRLVELANLADQTAGPKCQAGEDRG